MYCGSGLAVHDNELENACVGSENHSIENKYLTLIIFILRSYVDELEWCINLWLITVCVSVM